MGFMPAVFLLLKAPRVLAQANVVISPPAGSLGTICLTENSSIYNSINFYNRGYCGCGVFDLWRHQMDLVGRR